MAGDRGRRWWQEIEEDGGGGVIGSEGLVAEHDGRAGGVARQRGHRRSGVNAGGGGKREVERRRSVGGVRAVRCGGEDAAASLAGGLMPAG
ncbi:hypothetical protein PR202_ga21482 [Eleusine coracana subsp. coracana]|uniref:Uncharacterized protein n=1 Tax=Eleusine coracana subsp. coracana TaxID=191504 RepID=A0AAV5D154_ELECO|nr:hypothetical protein PR202_ga21482 [Eleusine coracana subsp. coracana]